MQRKTSLYRNSSSLFLTPLLALTLFSCSTNNDDSQLDDIGISGLNMEIPNNFKRSPLDTIAEKLADVGLLLDDEVTVHYFLINDIEQRGNETVYFQDSLNPANLIVFIKYAEYVHLTADMVNRQLDQVKREAKKMYEAGGYRYKTLSTLYDPNRRFKFSKFKYWVSKNSQQLFISNYNICINKSYNCYSVRVFSTEQKNDLDKQVRFMKMN